MTAQLHIVRAGPLATVQDRGRRGHRRFGVAVSGPMDWTAHALALRLAGCEPNDPAFEIGPGGLTVRAEGGPVTLGLAGWAGRAEIEGQGPGRTLIPLPARLTLQNGDAATVQPGGGTWAALAVRGLGAGPPTLGSYSTNARTGLGPLRPDAGMSYECEASDRGFPLPFLDPLDREHDRPIRLLPAPQTYLFDAASRERLVAAPYRVSAQRDRQGGRLTGGELHAPGGHDIVSDALVEGAIQVPGDGQPIVLTADCAPTGGYPKIAVVTRADLPRLVQARAGDEIAFAWTDEATAREALFSLEDAIAQPQPRRRAPVSAAFLGTLPRR